MNLNWTKILLNVAGVAAGCFAMQGATAGTALTPQLVTAIVMCVVANQVGLHQSPPRS